MQAVVVQQNRVMVRPISVPIFAPIVARIAICLIVALLFDTIVCVAVCHAPMIDVARSAAILSGEPVLLTGELPAAPLSDEHTCQHAHCSVVLMVLSLLVIPLLRRTPIMLPSYNLAPQIIIAPLLPPP